MSKNQQKINTKITLCSNCRKRFTLQCPLYMARGGCNKPDGWFCADGEGYTKEERKNKIFKEQDREIHYLKAEIRQLKNESNLYEYNPDSIREEENNWRKQVASFKDKTLSQINVEDVELLLGKYNSISSILDKPDKQFICNKENLIHLGHCVTCWNWSNWWPFSGCYNCPHNILIKNKNKESK